MWSRSREREIEEALTWPARSYASFPYRDRLRAELAAMQREIDTQAHSFARDCYSGLEGELYA